MSDEYAQWLERNGDVKCTCGHPYRRHLADLSGCADCNDWEPVHLRCEGFDLVHAGPTTCRGWVGKR